MKYLIPAAAGSASVLGDRLQNQDRLSIAFPWAFVLDGVGGSDDGGRAAQIALADLLSTTATEDSGRSPEAVTRRCIEHAHHAVVRELADPDGRVRGATTVTAVHFQAHSDGKVLAAVGSVGDSPAWVVTKGSVPVRVTRNVRVPGSSILADALGWPHHNVEIATFTLSGHSRILLASDGLEVLKPHVRDKVAANFDLHPQACASQLVATALQAGVRDNTTVLVIDVHYPGTRGATDHLAVPLVET